MFSWYDEMLKWDPTMYGSIFVIHPVPEDIWRPRVVLINTLGDRDLFGDDKAPVFLTSDGLVRWIPGSLFPASCQLDVTNFPFDQQTCTIELVAMTQSKEEMQFVAMETAIQKHFFITHGEWDLAYANVNITEISTNGIALSTIDLIFVIERRPAFLIINVVLPIVFLSFLNIMVFVIPADSGEKISYGITVLLSLSVFLSTVSGMLPTSSLNMAKLTIYLFILLIISMLTVVDTIIIVFLANLEEKETRHIKAKDNFNKAVTKTSVLSRAMKSMTKLTSNKVNGMEPPIIPSTVRMSSVSEEDVPPKPVLVNNDKDSEIIDKKKDGYPVNRYRFIGKHINRVSFIVFLVIWLVVTLGFMIDISNAVL